MNGYAHFGIIGQLEGYAAEVRVDALGYCSALAGALDTHMGIYQVLLDGSWHNWGPDGWDEEASLHVVGLSREWDAKSLLQLRHNLDLRRHHESRLLDYAVITTEDWSEVIGVALFVGSPDVVVLQASLPERAL